MGSSKFDGVVSSKEKISSNRKTNVKKKEGENFIERKNLKFASHWPISSKRPHEYKISNSSNGSSSDSKQCNKQLLSPGETLIKCSGSDIRLSKSATANNSISKGIGRFLILLPGQFSFRQQSSSNNVKAAKDLSSINGSDSKDENGEDEKSINSSSMASFTDGDNENNESSNSNLNIVNNSANNITNVMNTNFTMGKIHNLDTDNPILTVPCPDSTGKERTLIFRGKKIDTSSKFMALTCKRARSGGSVACRDIFQQLIVFGDCIYSYITEGIQMRDFAEGISIESSEKSCEEENSNSNLYHNHEGLDPDVNERKTISKLDTKLSKGTATNNMASEINEQLSSPITLQQTNTKTTCSSKNIFLLKNRTEPDKSSISRNSKMQLDNKKVSRHDDLEASACSDDGLNLDEEKEVECKVVISPRQNPRRSSRAKTINYLIDNGFNDKMSTKDSDNVGIENDRSHDEKQNVNHIQCIKCKFENDSTSGQNSIKNEVSNTSKKNTKSPAKDIECKLAPTTSARKRKQIIINTYISSQPKCSNVNTTQNTKQSLGNEVINVDLDKTPNSCNSPFKSPRRRRKKVTLSPGGELLSPVIKARRQLDTSDEIFNFLD